MDTPLSVGALFSGIGGLELGLERAGMNLIWHSEIDPFCIRVHEKHWPSIPNLGDVTEIDWADVPRPDLLCGGFPCQPVSVAGKRKGQMDARWLWSEFARALRSLLPPIVLIENVPGLRTRGLGDVLCDLSAAGYDAEWNCVPASAFGAPHRRSRLFILAYPQCRDLWEQRGGGQWTRGQGTLVATGDRQTRALARPRRHPHWGAQPAVCRVVDGVSDRLDRLRALGNAVVPQVAEWIGRRIMDSTEFWQQAFDGSEVDHEIVIAEQAAKPIPHAAIRRKTNRVAKDHPRLFEETVQPVANPT